MVTLIVVAVILLIVLAIALFAKKMAGLKGDVDAARAEFQQQVGYEYASALRPGSSPSKQKSTPNGAFTHYFEIYREGNKRITVQSWQLAMKPPPKIFFQLVDKKLVGTTRKLLNWVGPVQRTLSLAYPGPHSTGDVELDARVALYTAEPERARAVIQKSEIRKALLELASVSLVVDETGIIFGDPNDANVYAMGASRTDVNPAPAIRSAMRVHLAVQRLLEMIAQATT